MVSLFTSSLNLITSQAESQPATQALQDREESTSTSAKKAVEDASFQSTSSTVLETGTGPKQSALTRPTKKPTRYECSYSDISNIQLLSAGLIRQEMSDTAFAKLMTKLAKQFSYTDYEGTVRNVRGSNNTKAVNKEMDLRGLLTTDKIVSKNRESKNPAVCASEALKIISDALIADEVEPRSVIRNENYRILINAIEQDNMLALGLDLSDDTPEAEEQEEDRPELLTQDTTPANTKQNVAIQQEKVAQP